MKQATNSHHIDSGDGVFVTGVHYGTFNPTEKPMKAEYVCENKVKDRKIIEFNQSTGTFRIAHAMGLTIE